MHSERPTLTAKNQNFKKKGSARIFLYLRKIYALTHNFHRRKSVHMRIFTEVPGNKSYMALRLDLRVWKVESYSEHPKIDYHQLQHLRRTYGGREFQAPACCVAAASR